MTEEKYYIFSQSEFLAMLLLAGGSGSTVGMCEEAVDAETLAEALTGLFARGLIRREGERLIPDGDGELFYEISGAAYAVVLGSQAGRTAVCYVCSGGIWVCELMHEGLRVKRWTPGGLSRWLIDSGLLELPALHDEDTGELAALQDGRPVFQKELLLSLERYKNGGELLKRYEIVRTGTVTQSVVRIGDEEMAEFYTQEALDRMLADAFSSREI